jgi:transposase-like protein
MARQEYPKTIMEFAQQFHNDEVCLKYLIESRWPDGFICPHCRQKGGWWLEKYARFECKKCHKQVSPLAGTLLHRSHLPVHLWFWAAYLVTTHTPGMSAVQLQRQLGVSKIDTAWFLLHRLRQGMLNVERAPLSGLIEADETHIGGPAKGKKGRGVREAKHKTLIGGAVEVLTYLDKSGKVQKKSGRLRLQILKSASEEEIGKFIRANIALGSTIKSDGWKGYSANALAGYHHHREVQGRPQKAHEIAPQIHQVFSNLKAWLIGIHHGVDPKYLQSYLDEFVFRFNRRGHPMSAFRSLFEILMIKQPIMLRTLIKS